MMRFLRGLYAIAAQRGDGLRPEFLKAMDSSREWPNIESIGSAAIVEATDTRPVDETENRVRSAEVLAGRPQERG